MKGGIVSDIFSCNMLEHECSIGCWGLQSIKVFERLLAGTFAKFQLPCLRFAQVPLDVE